jgi:hypothetical protein
MCRATTPYARSATAAARAFEGLEAEGTRHTPTSRRPSSHRLLSLTSPAMASTSHQTLPRHDTFQSDDNFTVSFYVRDLAPADVSVSFRERSVRLAFPFRGPSCAPIGFAL